MNDQMTYEEAFNTIKNSYHAMQLFNHNKVINNFIEAARVALPALEKYIIKKPTKKEGYLNSRWCPVCDHYLGEVGDSTPYCPMCGQRINWAAALEEREQDIAKLVRRQFGIKDEPSISDMISTKDYSNKI